MTAYYNEFDPFAADWLENLILVGAIAPGVVDRRSIEDVAPSDLKGFTQCHFFAGIGGWSVALRQAGWPDDRPVWTGSCPCQPFSSAGKGAGFDDERHLWPAFHHLITLCGPSVVLGEQVSSKDALAWLDLVHTDMEATGYAFGALDLCAAGVGAPHIRQRTYWVADAQDQRRREQSSRFLRSSGSNASALARQGDGDAAGASRPAYRLGDDDARLERFDGHGVHGNQPGRLAAQSVGPGRATSGIGGLDNNVLQQRPDAMPVACFEENTIGWVKNNQSDSRRSCVMRPGPTNGFWRNADWLGCTDGKWRSVEPGTFPLAHGISNRVGSLRGYGNAIVVPLAQEFIETVMEYLPC